MQHDTGYQTSTVIKPCQTYMMEDFSKLGNGQKPVTILKKLHRRCLSRYDYVLVIAHCRVKNGKDFPSLSYIAIY